MRFYFLIGNYLETSETYLYVLFCIIEKDANFSAKIIEIFKFLLFPIDLIAVQNLAVYNSLFG